MGLYELLFEENMDNDNYDFPPLNISREIWFAFLQEFSKWKDNDVYAISFFLDFDTDDQKDIRLYFGYNTETHYQNERCYNVSDTQVRWDYEFWLKNELFYFGEDDFTQNMLSVWIRQQHIAENQIVERLTEQLVYTVREIHKSKILEHRFRKEIPIIIHHRYYYPAIAVINMEANGSCLSQDFIDYCSLS